jgi:hypothetical protein
MEAKLKKHTKIALISAFAALLALLFLFALGGGGNIWAA